MVRHERPEIPPLSFGAERRDPADRPRHYDSVQRVVGQWNPVLWLVEHLDLQTRMSVSLSRPANVNTAGSRRGQ